MLETAVSLIDEFGPIGFTVDALLDRSGISKGSLYHHFVDFSDVIEQAQVIRFSRYIDEDIKALFEMLSSTSLEEIIVLAHCRIGRQLATSEEGH